MQGMKDADSASLARSKAGETKRAHTRSRILSAAHKLFADVQVNGGGPGDVSAARIARSAGTSVSSVYNHFPGGVLSLAAAIMDVYQAKGIEIPDQLNVLVEQAIGRAKTSSDVHKRLLAKLPDLSPSPERIDEYQALLSSADRPSESPIRSQMRVKYRILLALSFHMDSEKPISISTELLDEAAKIIADEDEWSEPYAVDNARLWVLLTPRAGRFTVSALNLGRALEILRNPANRTFTQFASRSDTLDQEYNFAFLASLIESSLDSEINLEEQASKLLLKANNTLSEYEKSGHEWLAPEDRHALAFRLDSEKVIRGLVVLAALGYLEFDQCQNFAERSLQYLQTINALTSNNRWYPVANVRRQLLFLRILMSDETDLSMLSLSEISDVVTRSDIPSVVASAALGIQGPIDFYLHRSFAGSQSWRRANQHIWLVREPEFALWVNPRTRRKIEKIFTSVHQKSRKSTIAKFPTELRLDLQSFGQRMLVSGHTLNDHDRDILRSLLR